MIHSPGRCEMLQSTPLIRGPTFSLAHFRLGIGSDTKLSHPRLGPHHIPGSPLIRGPTFSLAHFWPRISSDTKLSHPGLGPHHIPGSTSL
ncbi:hypothetical protein ACFX2K_017865 [Malus domestica]